MLEKDLQKMCVKYLKTQYQQVLFYHSPSEGKRSYSTASCLHSMGFSPGFPDLIIFDVNINKFYNGLAIEFKSDKGKQTDNQIIWETKLKIKNWLYQTVNNFDMFKNIIDAYLRG